MALFIMARKKIRSFFFFFILLTASACRQADDDLPLTDDPDTPTETPVENLLSAPIAIEMNPGGLTPLAGVARIQTRERATVEAHISGGYPISVASGSPSQTHELLLLGFYAGQKNELVFKISNADNLYFGYDTLQLETPPLPGFLPDIEVIEKQEDQMEPGWNLIEMSLGGGGYFRFYPLIFDPGGQIRWYMNLEFIGGWIGPFHRLNNGNWIWAQGPSIFEYDMLGREVRRWAMPGYWQHHDLIEKPNGNLIVCVSKEGLDTGLDHIIELDRSNGAVLREWDLRQILDVDRFDLFRNSYDWIHVNSVWYDETDEGLLISGRGQGVIKVSKDKQLQWILAPHQGWGPAGPEGDGLNTADYLLTAVNSEGEPYSQAVQQGLQDAPGFSWPWGQHACMIAPQGYIFCFDNGWQKHYGGNASFIRAVEYKVSPARKEVEQIWEYGKERGSEIHSSNISDVDYLPATGNRLLTSGNIQGPGIREGRLIEVSYPEGKVLFEAVIRYKNSFSNGGGWAQSDIIYRAERLPLYPE